MYKWVFFLSLLGIALSGYALYLHYAPAGSGACNWSETFSCDLVNKSKYAEIYGIPVSLLGLGGYAFLGVLSWLCLTSGRFHRDVVFFAVIGFLFSLYLTHIEAFVLKTWCPVCLLSQAIILAIVVLSVVGLNNKSKSP